MKKINNVKKSLSASLYSDSKDTVFKRAAFKQKHSFSKKKVFFLLLFLLAITVAIFFTLTAISNRLSTAPDLEKLSLFWETQNYKATYEYSNEILTQSPFHNTALTYNGYAAFYLALASTDSVTVHTYIDEAINSLRLALLEAKQTVKPQIEYMLGKAYFHKNRLSAYYFYSDLAIKYLHSAHNNGYNANDIFEYLGLSYAALDMTRESISYFTEALLVNDSDILQIAIAEQYYKIENYDAAKPYLQRVKTESDNVLYAIQCSNILGQIYLAEENYSDAQKEFENMLILNNESADAYYGLGLLYESQGDFVKARAQWRTALDYEANHQGARLKMK